MMPDRQPGPPLRHADRPDRPGSLAASDYGAHADDPTAATAAGRSQPGPGPVRSRGRSAAGRAIVGSVTIPEPRSCPMATTAPAPAAVTREPELLGQTVLVIGGSSGIGLETARRARAEGADVILVGRDPGRLEQAATELGAKASAAFDATDPAALKRFFSGLTGPIDHEM